jgi:hypothetical protein
VPKHLGWLLPLPLPLPLPPPPPPPPLPLLTKLIDLPGLCCSKVMTNSICTIVSCVWEFMGVKQWSRHVLLLLLLPLLQLKYDILAWRPITAFRSGFSGFQAVPSWEPLL